MKIKDTFLKIKHSKLYNSIKTLFTLGGNSKFAPSSLTFFIMISLVPVITLIVYLLSLLGYQIEDILKYIQENLDLQEQSMNILEHYFLNIPSISKILFGIGIFVMIYISSKGITFFMYAYAKINDEEMKFKKFFIQRLWGVITSLILEAFLSFLIIFLVLFDNILFIENQSIKSLIFSFILLVILFVFFLFLYSISSSKKTRFKDVYLGALISSLSISVGMSVYIYYLDNYSNAINYYGSLTNFILLLLIIYYSSYIALLGVQINKLKRNPQKEDSFNKL